MSENQASAWGSLLSIGAVVVLIAALVHCSGDCAPHQKGELKANNMKGNRIEQCDGVHWVPVKRMPE